MTVTSNEQLNKNKPHLRDLSVVIDGLNVVDIQVGGAGAWATRLSVQLSGDMGNDDNNGGRKVFLNAAEYLRALLFNGGASEPTPDAKVNHNFVPHANVSREDLEGDFKRATELASLAIQGLLDTYNTAGNGPDELVWANGALSIRVTTVDFDLTEKKLELAVEGDGVDLRNTTLFVNGEQQPVQ